MRKQVKNQEKKMEKKKHPTNKAEIVIIPNKALKPKVIKMLNELKRIKEHSESFNKGLGNIEEPIVAEEYNN